MWTLPHPNPNKSLFVGLNETLDLHKNTLKLTGKLGFYLPKQNDQQQYIKTHKTQTFKPLLL